MNYLSYLQLFLTKGNGQINFQDLIRFGIPFATSALAAFYCPMGEAGSTLKGRPPAYVFQIVWPLLYTLLGVAWIRMKNVPLSDASFLLLSILMAAWIIFYSCLKKKMIALYLLLLILATGLFIFGYVSQKGTEVEIGLMSPFLAWIVFALILNFTEVNQ